jgi:hypothetical protein
LNYIGNKLGLISNVTFLHSQEPWWKAHRFASDPYQRGLEQFHDTLCDEGFIQ